MKKQHALMQWWCPPFSDSPDPNVRRAWREFTTYKGDSPYSVGDAIAFMSRRVPQRAGGGSGSSDVTSSQLRIGLQRFLREMRA
jgi:hypothetical protein